MLEPWIVFVLLAIAGIGIAIGYAIGRSQNDSREKQKKAEEELEQYKGQVAEHFGKTAELFDKLTHDYREVYEHLAQSSESLCGDQVPRISADVPKGKLLAEDSDGKQSAGVTVEAASVAVSTAAAGAVAAGESQDEGAEPVAEQPETRTESTAETAPAGPAEVPEKPAATAAAETDDDGDAYAGSWKSPVVAPPAAEAVDADIMAEDDEPEADRQPRRA